MLAENDNVNPVGKRRGARRAWGGPQRNRNVGGGAATTASSGVRKFWSVVTEFLREIDSFAKPREGYAALSDRRHLSGITCGLFGLPSYAKGPEDFKISEPNPLIPIPV